MKSNPQQALNELASEFATARQSNKRKWFPEALWRKAILIAQQFSIAEVCLAIKVHPSYFQKKIALLNPPKHPPVSFLELPSSMLNTIVVHVESSHGHKLSIQGVMGSNLPSILSEFLKGGSSCSK